MSDPPADGPTHVAIGNTEEKGSGVNLATYLVHDAGRGLFDEAVVLSQDTHLVGPVRIVRDELRKLIGIIVLDGRAPGNPARFGSYTRHLTPKELALAPFPEHVSFGSKGKAVSRPDERTLPERDNR